MKPSLAELMLMNNLVEPERSTEYDDHVKYRGLTGKAWSKRKSRSKIAKQSRKRNR
ncbi:hypothetical protein [Desulfosporosinus nitroreducens]|uniref:hypothetical protein n=1 Tax=Desulfosporosinus nitroreducens TaxID=2018668 RepID=UPI00207CA265|nr:hypothetical protein [Desulfosporosinus nitroreducens]MCO1599870.1 hypothetical protein [Desulfosporosinus nitroreducens]